MRANFECNGNQVVITDMPKNMVTYIPKDGASETWSYSTSHRAAVKYWTLCRMISGLAYRQFDDNLEDAKFEQAYSEREG